MATATRRGGPGPEPPPRPPVATCPRHRSPLPRVRGLPFPVAAPHRSRSWEKRRDGSRRESPGVSPQPGLAAGVGRKLPSARLRSTTKGQGQKRKPGQTPNSQHGLPLRAAADTRGVNSTGGCWAGRPQRFEQYELQSVIDSKLQ